jgi:hypothetical protein
MSYVRSTNCNTNCAVGWSFPAEAPNGRTQGTVALPWTPWWRLACLCSRELMLCMLACRGMASHHNHSRASMRSSSGTRPQSSCNIPTRLLIAGAKGLLTSWIFTGITTIPEEIVTRSSGFVRCTFLWGMRSGRKSWSQDILSPLSSGRKENFTQIDVAPLTSSVQLTSAWIRFTPTFQYSREGFFFNLYLVCEAIGTVATPGLLCQPRVIVKMIVEKQRDCRLAG